MKLKPNFPEPFAFAAVVLVSCLTSVAVSSAAPPSASAEVGHPSFLSPHARPIVTLGDRVFVANTPADTVDVIDAASRKVVARVNVGVDPVSLALRPGGKELWVANHVSDSVSVIDLDPAAPTFLQVVATVQDFDPRTKSTRFDEPVGIAFAGADKAYVALSSENEIAVVNASSRKVVKRLAITAQDPRSIVVRNGRLYVIPFESNNKTQLSGGYEIDGDLVTFNAHEHSIANNNVLSLGHVTDVVKHPRVPDRDLYVFDAETDKLLEVVDGLGTLLYGLAVDSKGNAFIAQTDARNDANGRAGTKKHGLAEMENRAFLNRVTRVNFEKGEEGELSRKPVFFDLEPLPPKHPEPGKALATPFAVQVSPDDSTLLLTAAGSDRLVTMDAASGRILGRVKVGAVPRGIALRSNEAGEPVRAWVLNAVANTVSVVDLSDLAAPKVTATIPLHDPTHPVFKEGRIAFNTAEASTTRTFSCASCHPDGHTDQLLWVLKTPIVTGGNQIMPRSTMPVRGLRDTAPFHWDGIPGDPYGGINSASIRSHVEPNSKVGDPVSQTRHLVDGGLAATMARVGDETKNDAGQPGRLTEAQRDVLSKFLLGVTYPPAQRRAYDNVLTERAREGFELFHLKGDNDPKRRKPNVCGDCHRMPFWVSTNTPGTGMDAPTWRGAYDRFLILPQGRLNVIDFDFYRRVAEQGIPEREVWRFSWGGRRRFDPVWDMVLEGSTGHSGAFARQVTLNADTADEPLTASLLDALEAAAREGGVALRCEGVFFGKGKKARPVVMRYDDHYVPLGGKQPYPRMRLVQLAREGKFVGTFTGRHGPKADYDHPQPALWTQGPIHAQRGLQKFPELFGDKKTMILSGRHVREGAHVLVNGRREKGSVKVGEKDRLEITLAGLPAVGTHFLQVQNPGGLFSNDFIFHVAAPDEKTENLRPALQEAIVANDFDAFRKLLDRGADVNALSEDGDSPLSASAFRGRLEMARLLLDKGARVNQPNRDGNTPLHVAAFLCRRQMVELFLSKGAKVELRNGRRESVLDVVSGEWTEELAGFYRYLSGIGNLALDLDATKERRPKIAELLRKPPAKRKR